LTSEKGMLHSKKISVLIPIFNVQDYLEQCLDSVLAQSLQPYEVLLVYEQSEDQSLSICEIFARKYSHFKVIRQKTKGLSASRNTALDHATGDYVVFLDSDDFVSENMLAVMCNKAVDSDADIVKCGIQLYFNDSRIEKMKGIADHELVLRNKTEFFQALFSHKFNPSVCNAIYRRSLFSDLRFVEGKMMEDNFITPYLLLKSDKIVTIPDGLYYYRQRPGSTMHAFSDKHLDLIESNNQLKEILIQNGFFERFCEKYYAWSGFQYMITIKNAAKHSSYFKFRKYIYRFEKLVPDSQFQKVLEAKLSSSENAEMSQEQIESMHKTRKILTKFKKNNTIFWLKTKYGKWRKER